MPAGQPLSQPADADKHPIALLAPQSVEHVKQHSTWDCGLACSVMVLQALQVHAATAEAVYGQAPAKAVWTIQLAHLLTQYGCDVTFSTLVVGANPDYASEPFYRRNFSADNAYVNNLFAGAAHAGVLVQQQSMPWQALRSCLQHRCLVIVLVDRWQLSEQVQCCCAFGKQLSYAGHYLVLSAFDGSSQEFLVHDPACAATVKRITPDELDKARRVFGTDEDILIVSRRAPAESIGSEHSCGELGVVAD